MDIIVNTFQMLNNGHEKEKDNENKFKQICSDKFKINKTGSIKFRTITNELDKANQTQIKNKYYNNE